MLEKRSYSCFVICKSFIIFLMRILFITFAPIINIPIDNRNTANNIVGISISILEKFNTVPIKPKIVHQPGIGNSILPP